jgi:hypothetical protein
MPKTKTTAKLVDQLFVTNIKMLPIVCSSASTFRGFIYTVTGKHGTISLFRKSDFLQNVTAFLCAEYVGFLICI